MQPLGRLKPFDRTVKECLDDLGIDPVLGDIEEVGYTLREFSMYVLRARHEEGEETAELDRDFLDHVKESLDYLSGPASPMVEPELRFNPLGEPDD